VLILSLITAVARAQGGRMLRLGRQWRILPIFGSVGWLVIRPGLGRPAWLVFRRGRRPPWLLARADVN